MIYQRIIVYSPLIKCILGEATKFGFLWSMLTICGLSHLYPMLRSGFALWHIPPGPHLLTWINLFPAWISNSMHCNMLDEITYPFPNFNGSTVEVWEWISNFILHFTGHVINYPCWGLLVGTGIFREKCRDSKVHGANMEPTWVLPAPDHGPHVGPINLAIRDG